MQTFDTRRRTGLLHDILYIVAGVALAAVVLWHLFDAGRHAL